MKTANLSNRLAPAEDFLRVAPDGRGSLLVKDRAFVARMAELRALMGDYNFRASMQYALRVALNQGLREHSLRLLERQAKREARRAAEEARTAESVPENLVPFDLGWCRMK